MRLILAVTAVIIFTVPAMAFDDSPAVMHVDSVQSPQSDSLKSAGAVTEDSEFTYPISPERKELLVSYSRFKNIWRFAGFFIDIIILLVVLYTGLSGRLRRWAQSISRREFFIYLFYFIFFSLFMYVVNLPFNYYRGFIVEHWYGFSNQTAGEWFVEGLKTLGVGFVLGFIVVFILYWLINRFRQWWLYFAVGSIPFLVLVIAIFPVVVAPIFNKFEPLEDEHLAQEMTALAARAGIYDPDIFKVDASKQSKKLNAYFTGMFGTRRIVLYDNIIDALTVEELKFVMAHEIGHYRMKHIWKGLFVAVITIFVAGFLVNRLLPRVIRRKSRRFGIERLGDIAGLPLILLFVTIFGFIVQPIHNGISRYHEYNSDEYGLKLSGVTIEEAATTFDKLSVYNLSDPEPSPLIEFWFYDHPALNKRINNVTELYHQLHSGSQSQRR